MVRTMERFDYKGRVVEIFTKRIENRWTWAFTVDGIRAAANRDQNCCESLEQAVANAREMASAMIDLES
jgi:hypothetical protein